MRGMNPWLVTLPAVDGMTTRVEAETVEKSHDRADSELVVAGCADCDPLGCAVGALVLFKLVVAELIEALDEAGGGKVLLDDRACALGCAGELWVVAVDGRPVVRRIDQDLAGEEVRPELAEAVGRDGEDDDVGVGDDLVGRGRVCAGREHVDRERDVVGRA